MGLKVSKRNYNKLIKKYKKELRLQAKKAAPWDWGFMFDAIRTYIEFMADYYNQDYNIAQAKESQELIKKSVWKSDDAYYIDMCVTANNENKDLYNWLKEQEEAKFYNSISHTDHTEDGQDIIICDKIDKEYCSRCKHKEK